MVYCCDFEVDVNFHDQDHGHNLVEQCRIATPVWHGWDAIGVGAPNKHCPPRPENLLFNNAVTSKGVSGYHRKMGAAQPNAVYQVTTEFGKPNVFLRPEAPPKGGTFYAVKNLK